MTAKLRSWWQTLRKPLAVVGIIVACALGTALIVGIIGGYLFHWGWTGISQKTLWDWLQLLFVPAVLTLGALWFTARQNHDLEIAADNQREAVRQAYIDKMSDLLLEKGLRDPKAGDEVRKVARVRTLTVLSRLDNARKRSIVRFLQESGLIDKDNTIIDLSFANLREAELYQINLSNANLHEVDLRRANLNGANLSYTTLSYADLSGADLSKANLTGAEVTAHIPQFKERKNRFSKKRGQAS